MARIPFGFYPIQTGDYDPSLDDMFIKAWGKKVGDKVEKDEAILEYESDKASGDMASPASGVIAEIYSEYAQNDALWESGVAEELNDVPGGRVLYRPALGTIETDPDNANIQDLDEDNKAGSDPALEEHVPVKGFVPPISPIASRIAENNNISVQELRKYFLDRRINKAEVEEFMRARTAVDASSVKRSEIPIAVPAARQVLREAGIDLSQVEGMGDGGLVLLKDAELAVAQTKKVIVENAPALESYRVPINGGQIRKTIARLLTLSHQRIPKAGDAIEVDITALKQFTERHRNILQAYDGLQLRYEHFLLYLSVKLLQMDDYKIVNGYWDEDEVEGYFNPDINIGTAVQTPKGLMVPVVHKAEELTFRELATSAQDKIQRALEGNIQISDLRELTFTVNNVGAIGGEDPDPLIPYTTGFDGKDRPTGMILAMGRAKEGADGRWLAKFAFRFDHRLFDGAPGIRFVRALKMYLEGKEDPEEFVEVFSPDFSIEQK